MVDLIQMKAFYFDGDNGENIREEEIPADILDEAKAAHRETDHHAGRGRFGHGREVPRRTRSRPCDELRAAIRRATLALKVTPVFMGSAYKNKGVQLLLDAVTCYLPNPTEVHNIALDQDKNEEKIDLHPTTRRRRSSVWRSSSTKAATVS